MLMICHFSLYAVHDAFTMTRCRVFISLPLRLFARYFLLRLRQPATAADTDLMMPCAADICFFDTRADDTPRYDTDDTGYNCRCRCFRHDKSPALRRHDAMPLLFYFSCLHAITLITTRYVHCLLPDAFATLPCRVAFFDDRQPPRRQRCFC